MQISRPKTPRLIIVDVDVGCDDAWALFVLLKAMDCGLCHILAITCANGNTTVDNVARNVLRVLQTVGKEKSIPVFKGAAKELISTKMLDQFHGEDGLSDLEWDTEPDFLGLIKQEHAVNKIYELVKERPGEISLICLAPLTNIAIGLRMYEDLAGMIKDVYIMGGNNRGIGNTTKAAEFNFYLDSEAAEIVLSTLSCPVTIMTWEACIGDNFQIPMVGEKISFVVNYQINGNFIYSIQSWRKDVLGKTQSPIIDLLNPVEYKAFRNFSGYIPCDAMVACLFVHPEVIVKSSQWHVTVELNGKETRGQMVLDHLQQNKTNASIIERVSEEDIKKIMLWVCGHPEGNVEIIED